MNTFVFDETGECVCVINEEMAYEGKTLVYREDHFSPNLVWYDHAEGKMKFKAPMELTITPNTITGIPVGTSVAVGTQWSVVDDGEFHIEVSLPQTVRVVLSHIQYQLTEVEVPCEVQA